jgi:hypothetical protein
MILTPRIEGVVSMRSSAAHVIGALRQRVAAGLLSGRPHPRSSYEVVEEAPDRLRVRAANYQTAINVGLNDLELEFSSGDSVSYRVEYWRWASYVIGLGAVLTLTGLVILLAFDARGYIASHASARLPGLSIDQNVAVVWAMVTFWGVAWPWLLIALHKRPLRRLVEQLVRDADAWRSAEGR